jgi:hypothetical protein
MLFSTIEPYVKPSLLSACISFIFLTVAKYQP